MLIEFNVENFGSYRDGQTFSFVAASYNDQPEWLAKVPVPGLSGLRYLTAAGLFGANASGKSMLLDALAFMQRIVRTSASLMPNDRLPYNPFRLDNTSSSEPTSFFVCFEDEGVRYDYSFAYVADSITSESLTRYVKRNPQLLFELTRNTTGAISLKTTSRMAKLRSLIPYLETKQNALLLSRGAQEGIAELVAPYLWFAEKVIVYDALFDHSDPSLYGPAIEGTYGHWVKDQLLNLIRGADLGIVDITSKELPPIPIANLERVYNEETVKTLRTAPSKTVVFAHSTPSGTVNLSVKDESVGTTAYLAAATAVLRALEDGKLLLFDEIDCSLHPALTESLIGLFKGDENNPHHAQLLFTSHTSSLMDSMRRDQIWKCEKRADGTSTLEPLSDYHIRLDERKSAGYSAGRYGGIPVVDLKLRAG